MRLLKLNNIFLYKFLYLFTAIYIFIGIILFFIIKEIFIKQNKSSLRNSVDIILMSDKKDINQLKNMLNFNKNLIGVHIFLLNNSGDIIATNKDNISNLKNQKDKKEVLISKYENYGFSIRYIPIFHDTFIYIAKKFSLQNKIYFLQLGRKINFIDEYFHSLLTKFLLIFFIFIFIFFFLSWKISKKLSTEIKYILNFLRMLSKETKPLKITSHYSKEFNKITKLLSILSKKLSKNYKKKVKYENKLKLLNVEKDRTILEMLNKCKEPILLIDSYIDSLKNDKDIIEEIKIKFMIKIENNSKIVKNIFTRLQLLIDLDSKKSQYILSKFSIVKLIDDININLLKKYPNKIIFNNKIKELNLNINKKIFSIALLNLMENGIIFSESSIIIELEMNNIKNYR